MGTSPDGREFTRVYRAANATEAHVIRGMLSQHGIDVRLVGEGLSSGFGELPAEVIEVEIHVPTGYRQRARELLDEYENRSSAGASSDSWRCARCGQDNPGHFGVCWHCQAPAAD